MRPKLLVIDDDDASLRLVRAIFAREGYEVCTASDGPSGVERAAAERPDVVLLDLHLPGLDGLGVLEKVKASAPSLPVIMLTAHGDVKTAVKATQLGAHDYLTKPVDPDEVVLVVARALAQHALEREVEELRRRVGDGGLGDRMGPSPQAADVIAQVRTVAGSDFTVLVLGETGTGKDLVAQAIHHESERRGKPLIALDCGAIPENLLESELFGHEKGAFTGAERRQGRFQLAEGGTLFLDEIGNLPTALQVKLLRVLELRQVQAVGSSKTTALDVRFVAATNDDLQARVADGRFRADLYFRLAQYTITLPPLRERPADVPYLAQRFLLEASVELRRPVLRIAPDAAELLQRHRWPGNVRELRNVVRQAVLRCEGDTLSRAALKPLLGTRKTPSGQQPAVTLSGARTLREIGEEGARAAERRAICDALRSSGGNKSQAARALHTDFKTLHVKMKALGIRARDFEP
jgi:two-component system, NtrC family, response regulator AtoC